MTTQIRSSRTTEDGKTGFSSFKDVFFLVSVVSVVSVVSFRWFRFGVSGFSTCPARRVVSKVQCILTLPARSRKVTCHMYVTCHVTRTNRLLSFEYGSDGSRPFNGFSARLSFNLVVKVELKLSATLCMDRCLDDELSVAIKPGIIHRTVPFTM